MSYIIRSSLTDHHFAALPFDNTTINSAEKETKSFSNKTIINYERLNSKLANEWWLDVLSNGNVEESSRLFKNKLQAYMENSSKSTAIKFIKTKRKPWITHGQINSFNKRYLNKMDPQYKLLNINYTEII